MAYNLSDYDYELPKELIAQHPAENRTDSRLMLLNKQSGEISHSVFNSFIGLLNPGDCLVLNNTRVIPARLKGRGKTGPVEILLLNRIEGDLWECLCKPGKRTRHEDRIYFGGDKNALEGRVEDIKPDGNRLIRFSYQGIFGEILDNIGEMPLPPYITEKLSDPERYQTAYAKTPGSAAAPTAGLHFTEEYLELIRKKGVYTAEVTLHVGLGTFRPVKTENILEHKMHSEYYIIEQSQAGLINRAKADGGRIIAVGTTACRTLESCAEEGRLIAGEGWTEAFIYPGYEFKLIDGLLTNFHLPKSTLLMLISALAGRENVLEAYRTAVESRYRFFSFGDAMFIS